MVMVRPSWAKTRRAASIWVKINRRPPTSSHPSARERIHHRRWGSRRDSMSRSLPVGRDLAITDGSVRKKKRGGIGLAEKSARVVNLCSSSIFPRCPNWNAEHKSRLRNDKSFERCFHNPLACPHFVRSSCVEMDTNGFWLTNQKSRSFAFFFNVCRVFFSLRFFEKKIEILGEQTTINIHFLSRLASTSFNIRSGRRVPHCK